MSGYAPEAAFARSREAFAQAEEWLAGAGAAGLEHAALEEELQARGREMLAAAAAGHLDLRAAREQRRAQVTGPDGITPAAGRGGACPAAVQVLGQVTVSRIAYRAPGARNVHPADAELNLPPGEALPRAAQAGRGGGRARLVRAGVRGRHRPDRVAAGQAAVPGSWPGRPPPTSGTSTPAGAARRPAGARGGAGAACDGKGIVVRPGRCARGPRRLARNAVPKQDGRLSRGEVRTRKRMAEIAAVYDSPRCPRTAADILAPGPGAAGPRASGQVADRQHRRDAAEVVAGSSTRPTAATPPPADLGRARRREQPPDRPDQVPRPKPAAHHHLFDLIHVLEYLWKAAWCFFPEASPEAGAGCGQAGAARR